MTMRNEWFAVFCAEDSTLGDPLFSEVCAVSTRFHGHQHPGFHGNQHSEWNTFYITLLKSIYM